MKPTCPICRTTQPQQATRQYRCPRCKTRFEVGYDGPESNDPERSAEMKEARENTQQRHSRTH